MHTSGTTGFPKGVMLTHRNILNDGFYIGEGQKLTPLDRVTLPVPFFHCFGCVLGVMACLTHRSTMIIVEEFDASLVLQAIHKERATAVYGVPTMFIAELNHPDFDSFDLSSLRTGIMAGSSCPPETMREAIDRMNLRELTICYGLTETSPVFTQTSADDDLEHKCETVGKRHPPVLVKIVDPETGERCGFNEPGELCCKGYNVMKGYYKMPEETAKVIDDEGYLHSGDLGMVDEEGYYRVTGRVKDMIIRGGENIYPLEIENFLLTNPGARRPGGRRPRRAPRRDRRGVHPQAPRFRGHDRAERARMGDPTHRPLQGAQARLLRGRLPDDAFDEGAEVQAARDGRRARRSQRSRAGSRDGEVGISWASTLGPATGRHVPRTS